MNVYEEAHNLARAIKESHEFLEFERVRKEVEKNPELSAKLADLEQKQMELQAKQMTGESTGDMASQLQSMFQFIAAEPLASEYLQTSARFGIMMKDVYEILADAMQLKRS